MSKRGICNPCERGWSPTMAKTFDPTCWKCQEKLANGERTGNEPHPSTRIGSRAYKNLPDDRFDRMVARQKKARAKMREQGLATVNPRWST